MTVERFNAKVLRRGPDDCWPWQGSCNDDGYGNAWWQGRCEKAHRVAFRIEHGRWPDPCCLHSCDNRPCCNPRHLVEGTQLDNVRDCIIKGRRVYAVGARHMSRTTPEALLRGHRWQRTHTAQAAGERNGRAKLSRQRVLAIRAARGQSQDDLAAEHGVSQAVISAVLRRKTWRHIK